jgi:ribA/ribD-fused uncharacterized protein
MSQDIASLINSVHDLQQEVRDMKNSLTDLTASVSVLTTSNEKLMAEVANVNKRLINIDGVLTNTDQKYNDLLRKYSELNERTIFLETYSRRDNLLFSGIPEAASGTEENCTEKVYRILETTMNIPDARQIRFQRCHRLGSPPSTNATASTQNRPRAVFCKFYNYQDRQTVWKAKTELSETSYGVQEDFPKPIMDRRKMLLPIMYAAKRQKLTAYLAVDKLHIVTGEGNNKVTHIYDTNSLHKLPPALDPKYVSTLTKNKTFAFFGQNCPLSNFHSAPFTSEGHRYRHVEEYLFVKKAELAKDEVSKQKILSAKTPADCKWIGKNIKVDRKQWQAQEVGVMTKALFEKFSQNSHLKDYLLATGDLTIAEASPSDKFWGIGCGLGTLANSKARQFKWQGKNKLGELLMNLRTQFK